MLSLSFPFSFSFFFLNLLFTQHSKVSTLFKPMKKTLKGLFYFPNLFFSFQLQFMHQQLSRYHENRMFTRGENFHIQFLSKQIKLKDNLVTAYNIKVENYDIQYIYSDVILCRKWLQAGEIAFPVLIQNFKLGGENSILVEVCGFIA